MTVTTKQQIKEQVTSMRVTLDDGAQTTVHVMKLLKKATRSRLAVFDTETELLAWCSEHNVSNAMSGGFFLRKQSMLLGDTWINGSRLASAQVASPWNYSRGSLYISPAGGITVAPRYLLPQRPMSDLIQAGPLLLQNNAIVAIDGEDSEGFSEASYQFDDDITDGRFPRAAIGTNADYIFAVACDGRTPDEAGLTLQEFATVLTLLGVHDALNMDGGSSATIIHDQQLVNRPRGGQDHGYMLFESGRPIYSAIVFE